MNNRLDLDDYNYQSSNIINEMLLNNMNQINNKELAGSYDGYIKGNLFNDLYDQYKNYRPAKLIPNNEQAELLLNLNQTSFAMHDIRLYLDNHPNDKEMIKTFNIYQKQAMESRQEYEKKYGPINMETPSNNNMFSWVAYSWPWEQEEM